MNRPACKNSSVKFFLTRLEAVFYRLRQFGLKLHPEKCLAPWSHGLCKWSGKRLIQNQGSRRLSNTKQPREQFASFSVLHHMYVKGFAQIAKPLNGLLVKGFATGSTKQEQEYHRPMDASASGCV